MSDKQNLYTTAISATQNPKAVFLGKKTSILEEFAKSLSDHGVELFTGNNLEDAFFGNYFIYSGDENTVRVFIENKNNKLPKTLLIIPAVSEHFQDLIKKLPSDKVKLIITNLDVSTEDLPISKMLKFFLGNKEKILLIKNSYVQQIKETKNNFYIEKKTEIIPEKKIENQLINPTKIIHNKPEEKEKIIKSMFIGKDTEHKKNRKIKNKILIALAIICVLLIFPLITLFSTMLLGFFSLSQVENISQKNNFNNAIKWVSFAKLSFSISEKNISYLTPIFEISKNKELLNKIQNISGVGKKFSQGLFLIFENQTDIISLSDHITGKKKNNSLNASISKIKGNLNLADTQIAMAEAELKTPASLNLLNYEKILLIKNPLKNIFPKIANLRNSLNKAQSLLSVLPEIIGTDGNKKYLIVFQNNMELRPAGGFIGSFAIGDFVNGSLEKISIEDIYNADGALKGHVDPPLPISLYLGQEHWYMRDSNWDPDFNHTGNQLIWFLEKELDIKVDGVLAIDLQTAKYLLELTKGVYLSDYNLEINKDNFYEITQAEVQTDFFPGSTKKRDFLGSLGRGLLNKLITGEEYSQTELLQKLNQAVSEKHLQFYFTDKNIQAVIKNIDWDGGMGEVVSCGKDCVLDYLAVVEANLGINKVNYFINREISDQVVFEDFGKIQHLLKIDYQNNSKKTDNLLGGIYKNYLRIYLSKDAEVTLFKLNEKNIDLKKDKIASESAAIIKKEDNLTVVEALVYVEPEASVQITLAYTRKDAFELNILPQKYAYYVRKQAGTDADKFKLNIKIPNQWLMHPEFGVEKGWQIEYNTLLNSNLYWKTNFKKL